MNQLNVMDNGNELSPGSAEQQDSRKQRLKQRLEWLEENGFLPLSRFHSVITYR